MIDGDLHDEDLVVVDLSDPVTSGAPLDRRAFEERYAELAFGLGTVPRRNHDDDSVLRPGVVVFLVIALLGAVVLAHAGRADDRAATAPRPPVLKARTGTTLLLNHLGHWTALDVDHRTLRDLTGVEPGLAAAAGVAAGGEPVPHDAVPLGGGEGAVAWKPATCVRACPLRLFDPSTGRSRTVDRFDPRSDGRVLLAPGGVAVAVFGFDGQHPALRLVDVRSRARVPFELSSFPTVEAWSRDGRWLFALVGADVVAFGVDGASGRVDALLPPFESMVAR